MKVDALPKFEISLARTLRLSMSGKLDAPLLTDLSQIDTSGSDPLVVLVVKGQRGRNYTSHSSRFLEMTEIQQMFELHTPGYAALLAAEAEEAEHQRQALEEKTKLTMLRQRKRELLHRYRAEKEAFDRLARSEADRYDPDQSVESLDQLEMEELERLVGDHP